MLYPINVSCIKQSKGKTFHYELHAHVCHGCSFLLLGKIRSKIKFRPLKLFILKFDLADKRSTRDGKPRENVSMTGHVLSLTRGNPQDQLHVLMVGIVNVRQGGMWMGS